MEDNIVNIRQAVNKVALGLRDHPLVREVHINQVEKECWKVK